MDIMIKIYLSECANPILVQYLKAQRYEISYVNSTSATYASISSHPDIYLCKMGFRKVFYGNIDQLGFEYPDTAKFNAVVMGKYFIHNIKYTSKDLLEHAKRADKVVIDVPQGYTKCNMAIVGDYAAITSDLGIAAALQETEIDLLVIEPGHVCLQGQEHGFIGGASGLVGNEMIFHGNLSMHPDFDRIVEFVQRHGCELKYFEEFELEDIGSIIEF